MRHRVPSHFNWSLQAVLGRWTPEDGNDRLSQNFRNQLQLHYDGSLKSGIYPSLLRLETGKPLSRSRSEFPAVLRNDGAWRGEALLFMNR